MSFAQLAPDWQNWLLHNIERQCSLDSLISALTTEGGLTVEAGRHAVEDALLRIAQQTRRPEPLAVGNLIDAGDKAVKVLLALTAPRILLLDEVLSGEECDALVAAAEPRFQRSTVVDNSNGGKALDPHRSSSGTFFPRGATPLAETIEQRLATIARWPVDRGEGLQVLSYQPGAEYRPHYDWFDPTLAGPRQHLANGGQRVGTFVLYLTDVESGGATIFPELGLEVRPKKGAAVFFANVTADGSPDPKTLHGGQVVAEGVKIIATKWLREQRYGEG
jgi:prolyl 4-hydroxylase